MTTTTPLPCARASLDVGEPIYGTAPKSTRYWLLVEYSAQWAPKILDSPQLKAEDRAWLAAVDAQPGTRVQFIRKPGETDRQRVFMVDSAGVNPTAWSFDSLSSLLSSEPAAVLVDPSVYGGTRLDHPLFLVCTHGKRDICCARLGPSVFRAVARDHADWTWQTSHLGGHRFAATMLCLPHGLSFGRVDEVSARHVAFGYHSGRLAELGCYRGRACDPRPAQAAEYFLRDDLGCYSVGRLRLDSCTHDSDDRWYVTISDRATALLHELVIVEDVSEDLAPPSCGASVEPVSRYVLESHRRLT